VTAPHVAHTWPLGWTVGSIGGDARKSISTAPREAIKSHSHVAQGSEHHFKDRPALIASGGQLLVTSFDEVAF